MRILVDILHPAHVHFFKNYIQIARARGDEVLVTSRDKDMTLELLDAYGIDHEVISEQRSGTVGLLTEWAGRTRRLYVRSRRFRPHVSIGIMGVSIAPVSRALRTPGVVFYDTEIAHRTNAVVYPMARFVVTPDCYVGARRNNQVTYRGYHELAYLHPRRFEPDPSIVTHFGIDPHQPLSFVRFVGQDSSHDTNEVALQVGNKSELVNHLASEGQVVVSSEGPLPPGIGRFQLSGPMHQVHHLLAHADVYIGESATMATEAAVLATPSIFVGETSRGYVDDLAINYGLIDRYPPSQWGQAAEMARRVLIDGPSTGSGEAHTRLLANKIDVTDWIDSFLEQFRPTGGPVATHGRR